MAVTVIGAGASKTAGLGASALLGPALIITEQVQLAVIAGVFNLLLNGMTLYYAKKSKNHAEALEEVAAKNTQRIAETHDIVERRSRKRAEDGR